MRANRENSPTRSCLATSAMVACINSCCEDARIIGAYCRSMRMTSAPPALQRAHSCNNLVLEAVGAAAPGDVIGAELPDGQVGSIGQHVALEACHRS